MASLAWLDGQSLVAGCVDDHALKVLDVETGQIAATVLTDYKAPLTIDSTQGNLIVAGCEDAILRLFDVRANVKVKQLSKCYDGHQRAVTSVACNPQVENVLVSGSIDGTVKLWDLRNDEAPLA